MPRVLLPYIQLHGLPLVATLRQIKEAGFDGIEYHLIGGGGHRAVLKTHTRARELDLGFHVHQGWSLAENSTHWHNHVLHALGLLPKEGYTLTEHVPSVITAEGLVPIVVYADRIPEITDSIGRFWVQTCSTFAGEKHRLPHLEFLRLVKRHRLPVVFDTQHVLEYACGVSGVEHLPESTWRLFQMLKTNWETLKDCVKEIHLADFNPSLGNTRGRNVPLGTGVLPLRDFCQMVKQSGWDGTVVPEVSPFSIAHRPARLRALREQVHRFFE